MSEPIGSLQEPVIERKIDPNDPPAYEQASLLSGCVGFFIVALIGIVFLLTQIGRLGDPR